MILIRHRVTVRFRDCDPLGHVNNAVYLTYLEQARFALWAAQLNFVVAAPGRRREPAFILARAEVDFRAQAHHGDALEVQLSLGGFGRTSVRYEYKITDTSTQTLVAAARTVQVWFDYDAMTPLPIDDQLKARLSRPVGLEPSPPPG